MKPALSDDGVLSFGEHAIRLTPQQAKFTAQLIEAAPAAVSKSTIYDALYSGYDADQLPDPKVIEVIVHAIRRAIKPAGLHVVTAWGQGYQLVVGDAPKGSFSRLSSDDDEQIRHMYAEGLTHVDIARQLDKPYRTIFRRMKNLGLVAW